MITSKVSFAKPGLDHLVQLGDQLVEGHRPFRRRVQCGPGELVSPEDMPVAQPGLPSLGADPVDGGRRLMAGQQDEQAGAGEIQRPFQARQDACELGSKAIDGAGAVGDQVRAAPGEDLEVGDGAVAGA
ncbi:hypothetical protein OHA83_42300 [Streptomyces canus]